MMHFNVDTDFARWGEAQWLDKDAFLARDLLPSGHYVVQLASNMGDGVGDDGGVLPMLVRNIGAPVTFYGFHAAMHPDVRRPLPFYQGNIIAPAGCNHVLFSDPSLFLHETVKVGWFLGSRAHDLIGLLPIVMDHLDRMMNADRRLLWGVSAGGMAALWYGRQQDTVIAINPQTRLSMFTWGRVAPWLDHGWGMRDTAAAKAFVDDRFDILHRPRAGRTLYVQNSTDDHVDRHMLPWFAAQGLDWMSCRKGGGPVRLVMDDWGQGHIPPSRARQAWLIQAEANLLLREQDARVIRSAWWHGLKTRVAKG